jgi:hypothetical protein
VTVHVFCGQSITADEAARIIPAAVIHRPAWAADLPRIRAGAGDVVVLLDGALRHAEPVRHPDILRLLASGTAVTGAAGLGAARAAELWPYGMTGTGVTYNALRNGSITDDDVTCDLVPPGPPPPEAAPAVLARAAAAGAVGHGAARLLAARTGQLAGTARTWQAIADAAGPDLRVAAARFRSWHDHLARVSRGRARDARDALARAAAGALPVPALAGPLAPPPPGLRPAPPAPPGADVLLPAWLRPWQLLDPAFPARWRDLVLARAGNASARLDTGLLTSAQLSYWLTPAETARLTPAKQAALLLVRSVAQDPDAPVWPLGDDDARALAGDRPAPAPRPAPDPGALARLWGTRPGDAAALTAAARDRGFGTASAALRAAMRARRG